MKGVIFILIKQIGSNK